MPHRKCHDGAGDDAQPLTENTLVSKIDVEGPTQIISLVYIEPEVSRGQPGGEINDSKREQDEHYREVADAQYAGLAEILVDNVGGHENDGPYEYAGCEAAGQAHELVGRENLDTDNLGQQRIH